MTQDTAEPQPLIRERTLQAPAAKVWRALTDETALQRWSPFIPAFRAEVGFKFDFLLGPDPQHQYRHLCEVTEVVEGRKLTYSWRYDGYAGNSWLTYELFPAGDTTKLRLTWAGLESFPPEFTREGFESGSQFTFKALQAFVEDDKAVKVIK